MNWADQINPRARDKHPEPLGTMMHRYQEIENEYPPTYLNPNRHEGKGVLERAAHADAEWNNSDPFAYGRAFLNLQKGHLIPKEHEKEMAQRTLARQAARRNAHNANE
jgi:hypothetical protein